MTIQSYKMGPGTLKLGTAGALDVSCQVTSCRVAASENVDTDDDVDVLCGEVLKGDETVDYTWELSGTMLQDLATAGVVAWSWTNKGTWMDFNFIPNTVGARGITGQVRPIPLDAGGDSKTRPTSDFTWAARGPAAAASPVLGAAT